MRFLVSKDEALCRISTRPPREDIRNCAYREDVDRTHDQHNNAGSNDKSPERQSQTLLTCGLLIEIAEDAVTKEYHGNSEHDKARSIAEERPIS